MGPGSNDIAKILQKIKKIKSIKRPVLMLEETGVSGENHPSWESNW
jgi:hypothetical protein